MTNELIEFVPTVPRFFAGADNVLRKGLFSHRSNEFERLHFELLDMLNEFTGSKQFKSVVCSGCGTLANDIMLNNYLPMFSRPAVLSNGEFGTRLYQQCCRINPRTTKIDFGFGNCFDAEKLRREAPQADLLVAVACESSCGMNNNLQILQESGIPFLLDAVSAFGVENSFFQAPNLLAASGSSGKALAGAPGISLVFFRELPQKNAAIPHSLELHSLVSSWQSPGGCRNTLNSTLLELLHFSCCSIKKQGGVAAYSQKMRHLKNMICQAFKATGTEMLPASNSAIITAFRRPPDWNERLENLQQANCQLYHQCAYLVQHNIFEVATMGNYSENETFRLIAAWEK